MNLGQTLPLGDSGQGKSAIVSAELAIHNHTQTYEIGVPCYGPSQARARVLPEIFRNRCVKHIFLKCYWWLGGYSWLRCTNGPNPSQCPISMRFAI